MVLRPQMTTAKRRLRKLTGPEIAELPGEYGIEYRTLRWAYWALRRRSIVPKAAPSIRRSTSHPPDCLCRRSRNAFVPVPF